MQCIINILFLLRVICIILPNKYSTHFLNHEVFLALQEICLSLSVLEWDHPDDIHNLFGINNPDAIHTKICA